MSTRWKPYNLPAAGGERERERGKEGGDGDCRIRIPQRGSLHSLRNLRPLPAPLPKYFAFLASSNELFPSTWPFRLFSLAFLVPLGFFAYFHFLSASIGE
jgi:hypothetical protein